MWSRDLRRARMKSRCFIAACTTSARTSGTSRPIDDLDTVTRILANGRFDVIVDMVYDWAHGTPGGQVEATARAAGGAAQRYVFMSSIAAHGQGSITVSRLHW